MHFLSNVFEFLLNSIGRYNVTFYGTMETGSVRPPDMWPYNPETKGRFSLKNMGKKGYLEAIDQIEKKSEEAELRKGWWRKWSQKGVAHFSIA